MSEHLDLENCNSIKTIMMLSVILTHCCAFWEKNGWFVYKPIVSNYLLGWVSGYLGTFHTYVFVFLSGYLFCYLKNEKKAINSAYIYIRKRTVRLIFPYVITSALWIIPFYYYFYGRSIKSIVKNFIFCEAPSQLWFLIMLYGVGVLSLFIFPKIEKWTYLHKFILSMVLYCIALILSKLGINIFQLPSIFKYFLFYQWGYEYRKNSSKSIINRCNVWTMGFINISAFSLYYVVPGINAIFKCGRLFFALISCIFGVAFMVKLCSLLLPKTKKNRVFLIYEKYSFTMYLLHQQLIWISIYLFRSRSNWYLLTANMIAGFILSLVLAALVQKIPIVSRYMK